MPALLCVYKCWLYFLPLELEQSMWHFHSPFTCLYTPVYLKKIVAKLMQKYVSVCTDGL